MKALLLISVAILMITTASVQFVQGQTNKGRISATRTRRTQPKPRCPKAATSTSTSTTTPSGLTYMITQRSEGRPPLTGETVMVHYTGLLSNGIKFDSSHDRGEPFVFELGRGRVIKGWDEGIAKLRVGERGTLIIPPQLGYGAAGAGSGVIPSNATLVFIVELVGIKEVPVAK